MKAIYLTTDDPIYLPAFYDRVLSGAPGHAQAVFVVPPLYKKHAAPSCAGNRSRGSATATACRARRSRT